MRLSKI